MILRIRRLAVLLTIVALVTGVIPIEPALRATAQTERFGGFVVGYSYDSSELDAQVAWTLLELRLDSVEDFPGGLSEGGWGIIDLGGYNQVFQYAYLNRQDNTLRDLTVFSTDGRLYSYDGLFAEPLEPENVPPTIGNASAAYTVMFDIECAEVEIGEMHDAWFTVLDKDGYPVEYPLDYVATVTGPNGQASTSIESTENGGRGAM